MFLIVQMFIKIRKLKPEDLLCLEIKMMMVEMMTKIKFSR